MIEVTPFTREVVLIGGGHTHALLLRRWGMAPVPGARLTLINPEPVAPYTGMLPGYVAGHYQREELDIDLVKLCRVAGARIIFGRATGTDRNSRHIHIAGRPDIAYDIASIDIGITSNLADLKGFSEYGIAAKPLEAFASRWSKFLARAAPGPAVIIGGGVGGVELALAMNYALRERHGTADVTIVEAKRPLAGLAPRARTALSKELFSAGVAVLDGRTPVDVTPTFVRLDEGTELPSAFTVSTAGAQPYSWLSATGLHLTDGFLTVDTQLRSITDPSIYAVGDCAFVQHAPRPKAGVYAVRAAPVLTKNIRADLTGSARQKFRPQRHFLKLVSLGHQRALAERHGMALTGGSVWRWKDRIDRQFMERLSALPKMPRAKVPIGAALGVAKALGTKPLCGGCGAKVGETVLKSALAAYQSSPRNDIETSVGNDGAVLKMGGARQVITTDHLRAFWPDPYLMTRIAALHAVGDIWAMGAMPQALLAQITLPRLAETLQRTWLDECLAAAAQVGRETGAALVGGHTSIGAELTIGFTVTGLLADNSLQDRAPGVGDALILTRPIGSGILLAAEMSGDADGRDIAALLEEMAAPQSEAAALLASRASALTDVTGFGLAGHAARISDAAGLTAEIHLSDVPFYPGAERLADLGFRSSLYPANIAAHPIDVPETPAAALLFDPQTAGGLLAAVPDDQVEAILRDLPKGAAKIGRIVARGSGPIVAI